MRMEYVGNRARQPESKFKNQIQTQCGRLRERFSMMCWHPSKNPVQTAVRDRVLTGLTPAQINNNTTRGATPGMRDPTRPNTPGNHIPVPKRAKLYGLNLAPPVHVPNAQPLPMIPLAPVVQPLQPPQPVNQQNHQYPEAIISALPTLHAPQVPVSNSYAHHPATITPALPTPHAAIQQNQQQCRAAASAVWNTRNPQGTVVPNHAYAPTAKTPSRPIIKRNVSSAFLEATSNHAATGLPGDEFASQAQSSRPSKRVRINTMESNRMDNRETSDLFAPNQMGEPLSKGQKRKRSFGGDYLSEPEDGYSERLPPSKRNHLEPQFVLGNSSPRRRQSLQTRHTAIRVPAPSQLNSQRFALDSREDPAVRNQCDLINCLRPATQSANSDYYEAPRSNSQESQGQGYKNAYSDPASRIWTHSQSQNDGQVHGLDNYPNLQQDYPDMPPRGMPARLTIGSSAHHSPSAGQAHSDRYSMDLGKYPADGSQSNDFRPQVSGSWTAVDETHGVTSPKAQMTQNLDKGIYRNGGKSLRQTHSQPKKARAYRASLYNVYLNPTVHHLSSSLSHHPHCGSSTVESLDPTPTRLNALSNGLDTLPMDTYLGQIHETNGTQTNQDCRTHPIAISVSRSPLLFHDDEFGEIHFNDDDGNEFDDIEPLGAPEGLNVQGANGGPSNEVEQHFAVDAAPQEAEGELDEEFLEECLSHANNNDHPQGETGGNFDLAGDFQVDEADFARFLAQYNQNNGDATQSSTHGRQEASTRSKDTDNMNPHQADLEPSFGEFATDHHSSSEAQPQQFDDSHTARWTAEDWRPFEEFDASTPVEMPSSDEIGANQNLEEEQLPPHALPFDVAELSEAGYHSFVG